MQQQHYFELLPLLFGMYKRSFDFRKVITPANSTEVFALLAIIGGLCIALFLPELPIRLIGVCVSVLGGVGYFMLISQRLSETVEYTRKPVSQKTEFRTTVKRDSAAGKRIVFDDFATSFGGEDTQMSDTVAEDTPLPDELQKKVARKFIEPEPPLIPVADTPAVTPKKRTIFDDTLDDDIPTAGFADDLSEVRVVEKIVSNAQAEVPDSVPPASPSLTPYIAEPVDSEFTVKGAVAPETIKEAKPAAPLAAAALEQVLTAPEPAAPMMQEAEPMRESSAGHKRARLNIQIEDLMEEYPHSGLHNEPRKEFDYLLSRVLMVIRSVTTARTAAFFWVNYDKRQLVLESYISDDPDFISQQRKFMLNDDVISQIALGGRPEILTEIKPTAELDLIPYYVRAAGTVSFIGVPVFFGNTVVGVLCADTRQPDAYDGITVGFFGHFTKLISGLVQSYTGKYDLLQGIRALDAISHYRQLVSQSSTNEMDICSALVESASAAIEYSAIGIGMFDHEHNVWRVHQYLTKEQGAPSISGELIDLDYTLIGNTILTAQTTLQNPVHETLARVADNESILSHGYFVSVPLKSMTHNYGALFVEGPSGGITEQDVNILEILGEQTGTIIEQLRFQAMLHTTSLIDESRGTLNQPAFYSRLTEEIARSADFTTPITLVLIHLDHYFSLETSPEIMEYMITHIISIIRKYTKPYDIIGGIDATTLSVALIGQKAQKAQIWAERIRKEVASSVIDVFGKRFTVTVSIGAAESMPKESADQLIQNAQHVLQLALQKSNSVSIFG
ncbi:MAG: GAF domain-containing protein [Candidatus Kapaibacterium sp.]